MRSSADHARCVCDSSHATAPHPLSLSGSPPPPPPPAPPPPPFMRPAGDASTFHPEWFLASTVSLVCASFSSLVFLVVVAHGGHGLAGPFVAPLAPLALILHVWSRKRWAAPHGVVLPAGLVAWLLAEAVAAIFFIRRPWMFEVYLACRGLAGMTAAAALAAPEQRGDESRLQLLTAHPMAAAPMAIAAVYFGIGLGVNGHTSSASEHVALAAALVCYGLGPAAAGWAAVARILEGSASPWASTAGMRCLPAAGGLLALAADVVFAVPALAIASIPMDMYLVGVLRLAGLAAVALTVDKNDPFMFGNLFSEAHSYLPAEGDGAHVPVTVSAPASPVASSSSSDVPLLVAAATGSEPGDSESPA